MIQHSQSVELSCSIGGLKLAPQVFAKAGSYTYTRDVPADKLQGDEVRIDFAVDHALPPRLRTYVNWELSSAKWDLVAK